MLMAGQGSDIKYAESSDGIFSGENGGVIKAYGNHIEGAKAAVTYQKDAAGLISMRHHQETKLLTVLH